MKTAILIAAAAGTLALSACSAKMDGQAPGSRVPPARVVGEPRSCIPINQISDSRVQDDRTIDFRLGSQTYRNTLPQSCPSLGFEKAFTYATSLSQLCDVDVIYVLRNTAGTPERGAGCGLGKFVPVELEKR